ncbi:MULTISPECIES: DUF4337 domain-containing protein [unclassified Roseateles]|uniref:DUF4337 domain-containing protein n=1 Tax=unclassified Roseateles TaxID=2626991 RepID=UPI0006FAF839|nr:MULTISPECIES: DUF4337 domain-containing protein [unclassified Roseateles]KQW46402.1 hypothetical protein ASC81_08325 [Pelomonas sp. Root405]KRA73452.1 hypothetical protein ASD88_08325 [Pelomonas sp. Root662]
MLEPTDVIDRAAQAAKEASADRLNAVVAVTVAILATFLGICKVKDDNIVQAMQQAQVDKLDYWAYYQARTIRADVADASATQLEVARLGAPPAQAEAYDKAIAAYRAKAADQLKKREELRVLAETAQQNYESLNKRDDQFDLSDALLAIAIALLAVTALTHLWPLFVVAMVPTVAGVVMGMAGLMNLAIHPNMLFKLLS